MIVPQKPPLGFERLADKLCGFLALPTKMGDLGECRHGPQRTGRFGAKSGLAALETLPPGGLRSRKVAGFLKQ